MKNVDDKKFWDAWKKASKAIPFWLLFFCHLLIYRTKNGNAYTPLFLCLEIIFV